ncbi:MAG: hypothetical protein JSW37_09960 [Anaerolineales bacterium]|jgi:hypothetical protein|nr:MAG: hypothetical protein JSW37_09960 [Anaerolineales bacterium]
MAKQALRSDPSLSPDLGPFIPPLADSCISQMAHAWPGLSFGLAELLSTTAVW